MYKKYIETGNRPCCHSNSPVSHDTGLFEYAKKLEILYPYKGGTPCSLISSVQNSEALFIQFEFIPFHQIGTRWQLS